VVAPVEPPPTAADVTKKRKRAGTHLLPPSATRPLPAVAAPPPAVAPPKRQTRPKIQAAGPRGAAKKAKEAKVKAVVNRSVCPPPETSSLPAAGDPVYVPPNVLDELTPT
jgi:hypothetical protein